MYPYLPLGKWDLNCCTIIDTVTSLCSCTLVLLTTFSSRSQSPREFIKHIQLHVKSKPTFTTTCTIIVITQAIPNCKLQLLNPIKNNNRNKIFNGRAKLRFNLTIQVAFVSILIQFAVCATFEVVFTVFTYMYIISWFFPQVSLSS